MELRISDIVILFHNLGISHFLLQYGKKKPIQGSSWEHLQERRLTEEEYQGLLDKLRNGSYNIAVVCGTISNGLIIQDFETWEAFEEFYGKDNIARLLKSTLVVKTTHGGVHVYYFSQEPCRRSIRISKEPPLDLLGEGGYAVGPSSVIDHALCDKTKCNLTSEGRYEVISHDYHILEVRSVYESTIERCRALGWQVSSSSANRLKLKAIVKGLEAGERNEQLFRYAVYLRTREKLHPDLVWLMLQDKNQICKPPLDERELKTLYESSLHYGEPASDLEAGRSGWGE